MGFVRAGASRCSGARCASDSTGVALVSTSRRMGHRIAIIGLSSFRCGEVVFPSGHVRLHRRDRAARAIQDHFFRLSGGRVDDFDGDTHYQYGRYEKTRDGWVVVQRLHDGDGIVWRLKFSVFGILLINKENGGTISLPRRLVPFMRPGWMPNWLQ